jgi:hypothetical protein
MKHIHISTGLEFDVSRLIDFDGKTHDMCVITKWDIENNFEKDPIIIDYYFGEYDPDITDDCIDEYYKKQSGLRDGLKFLEDEYLINCIDGDFFEPLQKKRLENSIETLKQII